MNLRRRVSATLCASIVLAATLTALATPARAADPVGVTVTGMTTYYDMEVVGDLIFLSSAATTVAVMDHLGAQVGTLTGLNGAHGMVASGNVLYVAEEGAAQISRWDLSTDPPTELTPWDTSAVGAPHDMILIGSTIWFAACPFLQETVLASVDLSTGTVADETPATYDEFPFTNNCVKLNAEPAAGDVLFVHGTAAAPVHLYKYDVSSGDAVFDMVDPWSWGTFNGGIQILPDGQHLLIKGVGGSMDAYSVADMSGPVTTYTAAGDPYNLGVSSDVSPAGGGYLAVTAGGVDAGVWFWDVGTTTSTRVWTFATSTSWYDVRFGDDGSRMFVTGVASGQAITFYSITTQTQPTTLALRGTPRVDYGEKATLRATISPPSAGRSIEFYRRYGLERTLVGSAVTNSNGVATLLVKMTSKTRYDATFLGDELFEPSTSPTVLVEVRHVVRNRMLLPYKRVGNVAFYHRTRNVYYWVKVIPNHGGRRVEILPQFWRNGHWRDARGFSVKLGPNSTVIIYWPPGAIPNGTYRLRSFMPEDARHLDGYSEYVQFKVTA